MIELLSQHPLIAALLALVSLAAVFGAVLGLSNLVGEDAGEQWEENKELASMAACQKMSEIIKTISAD